MGRCPRLTLNLLAWLARMLQVAPLAHVGRCPRLTLLMQALWAPEGTLSSSDLAVPAGIPFQVGLVGPDGTLSPTDIAGILSPIDLADLITVGVADVTVVGAAPLVVTHAVPV